MSSLQNEATLRKRSLIRQMDSIEEILTDEVYYSFVNIFSLIMLIFVTGVLGFHVLKNSKIRLLEKNSMRKKLMTLQNGF